MHFTPLPERSLSNKPHSTFEQPENEESHQPLPFCTRGLRATKACRSRVRRTSTPSSARPSTQGSGKPTRQAFLPSTMRSCMNACLLACLLSCWQVSKTASKVARKHARPGTRPPPPTWMKHLKVTRCGSREATSGGAGADQARAGKEGGGSTG